MDGAVALPTLSGEGVILQNVKSFYQLHCNASTCNWKKLENKLGLQVIFAVTMRLPADYTCE